MKRKDKNPKKSRNPLRDKQVKDLSEMEEIMHQFTILREDMDAKIATLAEAMQSGFETVNRRMDGMEYKMDVMKKDIDIQYKLLANKMDKVAHRVDNHEERITNLEAANS